MEKERDNSHIMKLLPLPLPPHSSEPRSDAMASYHVTVPGSAASGYASDLQEDVSVAGAKNSHNRAASHSKHSILHASRKLDANLLIDNPILGQRYVYHRSSSLTANY